MIQMLRRWLRMIPLVLSSLIVMLAWQLATDLDKRLGRGSNTGMVEESTGAGAMNALAERGAEETLELAEHGWKHATLAGLSLGLFGVLVAMTIVDRLEFSRLVSGLREREERWRIAVSKIGDAVLVADSSGKTVEINGVAEDLLGIPASEAQGKPLESLVGRLAPAGEKEASRPIFGPAGEKMGELAVLPGRRIRAEAEAAMRESEAVAEHAIAVKDRFLAALSHELRTPLTPVLMSVSAAIDDPSLPVDLHPMFEMIRRNIELEARLIDDLLDASMMGRGPIRLDRSVLDVHEVLRDALRRSDDETTFAGLRIELDLAAGRHHALADQDRLAQVFWSLIRNAAKYAKGHAGTLQITSSHPGGDPGRLVLEFRDDGIGFDDERLTLLFLPFEQGTDAGGRRGGGMGLGLSIGRHVVEMLGGRLEAQSDGPGCGSIFRVELPSVDAPKPKRAPSPKPSTQNPEAPLAPVDSLRILLVEDNKDTLRYIAAVLEAKGHVVEPVDRVEAARDALKRATFDLLISDIELPDGTGLEVMAEGRGNGLRGIAMSGFGSDDDLEMSEEAGFSVHLTKPIDVRSLEAAIREVSAKAVS